MTANRWWVRSAARWLARIDGVSGQIRLAMLGLTGLSTATLTLRQYGHGQYAWPLIGVVLAGSLVYTWLYTEGGVWNQMARDRQDLSSNFAGPGSKIEAEIRGAAMFAAINGRAPDDEEREMMAAAIEHPWQEYRDGIALEDE